MECDTIVISNPSMAVRFSMKQLCSHKLLRSASSKIHCILAQNFTASSLARQYDPQHWPIFSKHYSWLRVCTCNAKLSCSAAFSTGYMPSDVCLAIKAQNNCSEFTWVLLFSKVSAQYRYVILVKFFPPYALPLETRLGLCFVLCHEINQGHTSAVRLSLCSNFPQACWTHCRLISPANRYSCPIKHLLYCIRLVVLGR